VIGNSEPTCRACGAKIVWAKTKNGKLMPVDKESSKDGNINLEPWNPYPKAVFVKPGSVPGKTLHKSHFATCPEATRFRR